jgi:hypothetical protein
VRSLFLARASGDGTSRGCEVIQEMVLLFENIFLMLIIPCVFNIKSFDPLIGAKNVLFEKLWRRNTPLFYGESWQKALHWIARALTFSGTRLR